MTNLYLQLNPKQRAFVRHYVTCWNASEAARQAGYSPKTAYSQGQRLLKHGEVRKAIEEQKQELVAKTDLKAEHVLRDLETLKTACMTLDDKGKPMDASTAARCLELQGRYLNLWSPMTEANKERITFNIVVPESRPALPVHGRTLSVLTTEANSNDTDR